MATAAVERSSCSRQLLRRLGRNGGGSEAARVDRSFLRATRLAFGVFGGRAKGKAAHMEIALGNLAARDMKSVH